MPFKPIVLASLTALALLGPSSAARACACCTEPGQRFESSEDATPFLSEELRRMRFAPTAMLYADNNFPESVVGVAAPSDKPYTLKVSQLYSQVVIDATDPSGKTGKISFALPRRMSRLEVDPRDSSKTSSPGPLLYKEWRLDSTATLSGIFAAKGNRGKVRLLLQGRGNSCPTAEDFKHWSLSVSNVTGPKIDFRLLGELKQ